MRIKLDAERREDWTCFFCCHVRTATICLGIWQLLLHIMALTALVVIVNNPELKRTPTIVGVANRDALTTTEDSLLETPLPTPLSTSTHYTRESNMNTQISLFSFLSCLALVYGAAKGKPFFLLPFFCLKVFDLCIACVVGISYLCALPSLQSLANQAGPEVMRRQLHDLSPAAIGMITLLAFMIAISIKAYLLSIVWRCYRYLSMRRVSGRATVSVLGTSGLAEMGPDYDFAGPAPSTTQPPHSINMSLLQPPPEYSKLKNLPPPPPPPPETPPPPYSSTLQLNRN